MSMTSDVGLAGLIALPEVLDDVVGAVRDGQLTGTPTGELADTLRAVRTAQARLAWVALAVTREIDLSGGHVGDGALTTAAWLRMHARLAPTEAAGLVATARALSSGRLDATSAALASGQIDLPAAQAIAHGTAAAPAGAVELIEPHALDTARTGRVRDVVGLLRRFDHACDPERGDREALRRYERRGLSAATTLDGSLAGRFLLDDVAGAELLTALDVAEPHTPADTRSPGQRRADALATLARHYLGCPDPERPTGVHPHLIVTDPRPTPQWSSASASDVPAVGVRTAEGKTAGMPVAGLSPASAAALNTALADALARALSDAEPSLTWIGPVAPGTAARVACDAHHTVVGVDPDGTVRDVRRQRRYFTWAQRAAIIARDGDVCPWPYCDRPIRWSHGHHLHPHAQGGPTTIADGALPCSGHHVLLHEGGWTLIRLTDGRYLARQDRTGRTLGPEPHRRPRGTQPPPPPPPSPPPRPAPPPPVQRE
jgi:hypothetical protein